MAYGGQIEVGTIRNKMAPKTSTTCVEDSDEIAIC